MEFIKENWALIVSIVCLVAVLIALIFVSINGKRKQKKLENELLNAKAKTATKQEPVQKEVKEIKKGKPLKGRDENSLTLEPLKTESTNLKPLDEKNNLSSIANPSNEQPILEKQEADKKVKKSDGYVVMFDEKKEDWFVKKDGGKNATKRFETKTEAVEFAKSLANKNGTLLSIHKKDGKI